MINLLEETKKKLNESGKSEKDVLWVGNEKSCISWEQFAKIADIEYSDGYGSREIAYDLFVVGEKWWLERSEYDGSEWWEYKELPKKPTTNQFSIKTVVGSNGWDLSLEDQNIAE